ncbi:MAG: arsenite methyltransferase [Ignavibacterium sp.]
MNTKEEKSCCSSDCCSSNEKEDKTIIETSTEIKKMVKDKYSQIAENNSGCCSNSCCSSSENDYSIFAEDYTSLDGYIKDADLNLGCGIPTEFTNIKKGDAVVDLGCGAGNDVFIARALVGDEGKVIGIDMTEKMIEKAKSNNLKLGYNNIEFRLGEIEDIPLKDNFADVVVSNCVLNLVPDKSKAFSEISRILKSGGHFCVSDIVLQGEISDELRKDASLYAGCISGALQKDDYIKKIEDAGFSNIEIKKEKKLELPEELLKQYPSELNDFNENNKGIFSITVLGYKK